MAILLSRGLLLLILAAIFTQLYSNLQQQRRPTPHATAWHTYTDVIGDQNSVSFPMLGENKKFGTFVFNMHGEAFYLMQHAIASGSCASRELSILHIDHHDDMALPGPGIDNLQPNGCLGVTDEKDCALNNDNFLIGIQAVTGIVKRIMWLYPPHLIDAPPRGGSRPMVEPHTCLIGRARPAYRRDRRYAHRSAGSSWWGFEPPPKENNFPLFTCGSSPANSLPGQFDHRDDIEERASLDAFEVLNGRAYEFAMLATPDALTPRFAPRMLHNKTWFPSGGWILDLDLDYFVSHEEAPCRQEKICGGDSDWALSRAVAASTRRSGLCSLTSLCEDIVAEWCHEAPHDFVTPRKVRKRMIDVRKTLMSLLPSVPCLITIARSNEGAFTPLNSTMLIEDALLEMLREVYGEAAVGQVQYLRSAFSSREGSLRAYARLEEEGQRLQGRLVGLAGGVR